MAVLDDAIANVALPTITTDLQVSAPVSGGSLIRAVISVKADTLKEQFIDANQDRICVHNAHFHDYYLNVGLSGYSSFNVLDSEVVPNDEN